MAAVFCLSTNRSRSIGSRYRRGKQKIGSIGESVRKGIRAKGGRDYGLRTGD